MYYASPVFAVLLLFTIYAVHKDIHSDNGCKMTYMWRWINLLPFEVEGNSISKYYLYRYVEGPLNERTLQILPNDIPVLFVPGSGGSAKQVRSMASIMMNKTEMRNAPFRMHFFAVDFAEELSFLSGSTLHRQRDFVVKAAKSIIQLYSKDSYVLKKLIFVGHSFGGTIVYSLPAHPEFDTSMMDLVITLAAPLSAPPIVMDKSMAEFYNSMDQIWHLQIDELKSTALVSYSGGEKDFQVPDHLATITHSKIHFVHRPSWSIRDVNLPADHLCILWCNQLTRHLTRIMFKYGLEMHKSNNFSSARKIVRNHFVEEQEEHHLTNDYKIKDNTNFKNINSVVSVVYPWTSRIYRDVLKEPLKIFKLNFGSPYIVINAFLLSECDVTMVFEFSNKLKMFSEKRNGSMSIHLPYGSNETTGFLKIYGKPDCAYELTLKANPFRTWYLLLIFNAGLVIHFTFAVVVLVTILKDFLDVGALGTTIELYINLTILLTGFILFLYHHWILEFILTASVFYLLSLIFILAYLFMIAVDYIYTHCSSMISYFMRSSVLLLSILLIPFNIYLSNTLLLLETFLFESRSSFSLMLCFGAGIICTGLGLAGANRDNSVHLLLKFFKIYSVDPLASISLVYRSIDYSNKFIYLVGFHICFLIMPRVISLKTVLDYRNLFGVVFFFFTIFLASQTDIPLELWAFYGSIVMYILRLIRTT